MFDTKSLESLKAFIPNIDQLSPAAAQEALKPFVANAKAWGELTQAQFQAAQAAVTESVESFKSVKEPQAALENMKSSVEKGIALTVKHVQEATALTVEQFQAGVDAISEKHPAPESFNNVAKGLKAAASTFESAVASSLKAGTTKAAPAAKKARAA